MNHPTRTFVVPRDTNLNNNHPLWPRVTPISPETQSPQPPPTQTTISLAGLDTGTKVGIIVGITVIGILIIIGCGLGMLSCRNMRRRRKQRIWERNSGDEMGLELDSKSGTSARKDCKAMGLWDNLKIGDERSGQREDGDRRLEHGGEGRSEASTGDGHGSK